MLNEERKDGKQIEIEKKYLKKRESWNFVF